MQRSLVIGVWVGGVPETGVVPTERKTHAKPMRNALRGRPFGLLMPSRASYLLRIIPEVTTLTVSRFPLASWTMTRGEEWWAKAGDAMDKGESATVQLHIEAERPGAKEKIRRFGFSI